ncbi:SymE family type I addiction module toxin [Collimonas silvisoli]|uniref:SymE family type I addiction module toxin n=1 Tax=Collimonas silvisoli TaxID=2825884 RepID=UPI001B8CDFE8|nr:SymE family type I addiction module toxin [Collimonas silvisoli]
MSQTVGLYPGAASKKPWIRLYGLWLTEAGFTPQTRIKVKVTSGRLVITKV